MPNPYFQFKQFTIYHDRCAMKVTTDACLFGSWCAMDIENDAKNKGVKNAFEIGSGSGLLSLMVAQKTDCIIEAIEIDEEASQQGKENVAASPWKKKITVIADDVLAFDFSKQYDIIFSNPPFYENELASGNLKKNTAHHSLGLKLSALAALIKRQLYASGSFYLLLPYKRMEEAEKILKEENLYLTKKIIVHQSLSHDPFRIMIKGGHVEAVREEERIFIGDNTGGYTKEFIGLLGDYYLHL